MAESDLRELMVLLFIRIHHRASDKILRKTFLFMDAYMPKILTKFMDDGFVVRAKDPKYIRLWFFYLSSIGNRFLDERIAEIKNYEANKK